jgi:hypothetical protein
MFADVCRTPPMRFLSRVQPLNCLVRNSMLSDGAACVNNPLSRDVCCVCLIGGIEFADKLAGPTRTNLCTEPTITNLTYAKQSQFICRICAPFVFAVHSVAGFPQVQNCVVGLVSVDVVELV